MANCGRTRAARLIVVWQRRGGFCHRKMTSSETEVQLQEIGCAGECRVFPAGRTARNEVANHDCHRRLGGARNFPRFRRLARSPSGFPDPGRNDTRPAPDLFRQRSHLAEAACGGRCPPALLRARQRQCASRPARTEFACDRRLRERAAGRRRLSRGDERGRNNFHPWNDREHQSRGAGVGRKISQGRRRHSAHRDGASQQSRAVAAGGRTNRRATPLSPRACGRHPRARSASTIAHAGGKAIRLHPCLQLVRHDQSGGRALPAGARRRCLDAGRCRAKRRSFADRCAGVGLRFPRLFRTQDVWADRDRRALRSRRDSRRRCHRGRAAAK